MEKKGFTMKGKEESQDLEEKDCRSFDFRFCVQRSSSSSFHVMVLVSQRHVQDAKR